MPHTIIFAPDIVLIFIRVSYIPLTEIFRKFELLCDVYSGKFPNYITCVYGVNMRECSKSNFVVTKVECHRDEVVVLSSYWKPHDAKTSCEHSLCEHLRQSLT